MIDLTPLDVRNKRGDFRKLMRGYDPEEVDVFLEMVAERLEALTRENITLRERAQNLQEQVNSQTDREQAVQEALVTAQELRADIREQSQREADHILREAETEGRRLIAEAEAEARTKLRTSERRMDQLVDGLQDMERRRDRFLKDFRQLLERELDVVQVEQGRTPLEDRTIDLELGSKRTEEPTAEARRVEKEVEATLVEPVEEITSFAPDSASAVPPLDAPIDQLAAAYERAESAEAPPAPPPAPPPPTVGRQDNLLLYLDADDEERRG